MGISVVRLTKEQLLALVEDRLDGSGPCRIRDELPFTALAATSVVPNARIMMMELNGGGTQLTAKGNLNRRFVATLMARLKWPGYDVAEARSVRKAINEHDFVPAMYLHAVLRLAGLVRKEKGRLELTRKGRALLPETEAGRLQAALFRTTFAGYNLAYLDGFDIPEVFGPQIAFILYLLGQVCDDWRPSGALMRGVLLPTIELTESPYPRLPEAAFERRVLSYLCWFGLMERRQAAANEDWQQPRLYRKTALYDRTLRFSLPQ
jgi:hypothetical protein